VYNDQIKLKGNMMTWVEIIKVKNIVREDHQIWPEPKTHPLPKTIRPRT
jgi:hypothetical protein